MEKLLNGPSLFLSPAPNSKQKKGSDKLVKIYVKERDICAQDWWRNVAKTFEYWT